MSEVTMPRLSDTMQEGTISQWLKKLGDPIKKGDTLAEIETDKATMELEAFDSGVLEQILVQAGQTVPIGQTIAVIGSGANLQKQDQPVSSAQPSSPQASSQEAPAPTPAKETPAARNTTQTSSVTQQEPADDHAKPTRPTTAEPDAEKSQETSIKASPLARHMAEEHNIDLHQLHGTGPGGRIVRDDIEDVLEQRRSAPTTSQPQSAPPAQQAAEAQAPEAPAPAAPSTAPADAEVTPLSRMQTIIAKRLTESKQSIPHFYVTSEVDMTDALTLRQTLNANAGEGSTKVSVNDLIVKACALALETFPEVNSSFKDGQLIRYKHIHIGIAVDIPAGLVVPVIRDANIKGVRSIARESKALIEKARANKLAPLDLEGGTFSVSNLGMMDVTGFIAVINPPQSAILAVASTRKQFVPLDDQPVIRDLMTMTMSADHRVLYGATVARFLQEVKRLLQNPYTLLG